MISQIFIVKNLNSNNKNLDIYNMTCYNNINNDKILTGEELWIKK